MANHLYSVGEEVTLAEGLAKLLKATGFFTIKAKLPPLGDTLQYRIKCDDEPFERVVLEHQIEALDQASSRQFFEAGQLGAAFGKPAVSVPEAPSKIVRVLTRAQRTERNRSVPAR
jgi:hypothetical protein